MKIYKSIMLLTGLVFLTITGAFASNPFVDVPQDSWAYQSVITLARQCVIQGVDGSYFQGNRSLTRYEAAEMTAQAMAHMDRASIEQRKDIIRLADEFIDELKSLGIHVDRLENRTGNIYISGDARIRYIHQEGTHTGNRSWDYRTRIRATAYIDDHTQADMGVSTGNVGFSDTHQDDHTYIDDADIHFHF